MFGLSGVKDEKWGVFMAMLKKSDCIITYQWNTVKPVYNDHLMEYLSAFWSSSRWLQNAEIVTKCKLVPSVFIKNTLLNKSQVINIILEVVVIDRFHCNY